MLGHAFPLIVKRSRVVRPTSPEEHAIPSARARVALVDDERATQLGVVRLAAVRGNAADLAPVVVGARRSRDEAQLARRAWRDLRRVRAARRVAARRETVYDERARDERVRDPCADLRALRHPQQRSRHARALSALGERAHPEAGRGIGVGMPLSVPCLEVHREHAGAQ